MSPAGRRGGAVLLSAGLLLGGCKDLGTIAGIASGSASAAATGNPAVGVAVGIGIGTAGNFLVRYIGRVRAGAEQDVIASTAGELPAGGTAPWAIHHFIPIGNEHGELHVIDVLSTPIAVCKEVAFTVMDGNGATAPRRWYRVAVCRDPSGWKWATAEPAVTRWNLLQ
ncbi:MAG TPA: hypothetical protein VLI93_16610 [Acetobacteraceae bacterium]|nr:hypothetical protein [Acetobacteraceae bacterium]